MMRPLASRAMSKVSYRAACDQFTFAHPASRQTENNPLTF
jgi:hypothetical protein